MSWHWIKIDRVLSIHQRQIAEHGGEPGVRDAGLLESALARPENIAAYTPESDIARLAAAYAFGLIRNHSFVDGNKRTGYVVMETFIIRNGRRLEASPQEKYSAILGIADGSLSEDDLTNWLRSNIPDQK